MFKLREVFHSNYVLVDIRASIGQLPTLCFTLLLINTMTLFNKTLSTETTDTSLRRYFEVLHIKITCFVKTVAHYAPHFTRIDKSSYPNNFNAEMFA